MLYRLLLSFLFLLPPESAHALVLFAIRWVYYPARVRRLRRRLPAHPTYCAGICLDNPVGLAAGLDKNGQCLDAWFGMGFGFIELGTVTPKPQPGNPKPRLFRLPEYQALINEMGFNNEGVDSLVERLKQRCVKGVVGVNIGKNRNTSLENAARDYCYCLEKNLHILSKERNVHIPKNCPSYSECKILRINLGP